MMQDYHSKRTNIDWWTVIIYLALVISGWFSIYSSTYSGEQAPFYDPGYRYGMQLVWIGISFVVATVILFIDSRIFFDYSFIVYCVALLLMLLAVFVGKEVNGAHSWISLGPFSFQPVELMKIGTALLFARVVDMNGRSEHVVKDFAKYSVILLIPVFVSLLQNDAGSAMVFFVFFIVLYREGFPAGIFVVVIAVVTVTVLTFILDRELLVCIIVLAFAAYFAVTREEGKLVARLLAALSLLLLLLVAVFKFAGIPSPFGLSIAVITPIAVILPFLYSYLKNKSMPWMLVAVFVSILSLCFVVDTAFQFLKPHQQERILDIFGISTDPRGISYNVNQSKIAIGSGGLSGRGFLQGTQTQYSYVPEQETDFIFCTVGEEQGFLGTSAVVILFMSLVLRLMLMGERAPNPFSRVYCYCAAGVFFFHFVINISMTLGLFPVIGIPLPFFSYGGSSFLCFTIFLFVALRLDRSRGLDNF